MNVPVKGVGLILVGALWVAGCSGATPTPTSPPAAPATATSAPPPAATATTAPDPTATVPPPTEAPTDTPQVEASPTTPRETVTFNWAPGSVTPADADDVTEIVQDLRNNPGILGGSGDETVLSIQYDPTVITIEEIAALLDEIGHPVVPS